LFYYLDSIDECCSSFLLVELDCLRSLLLDNESCLGLIVSLRDETIIVYFWLDDGGTFDFLIGTLLPDVLSKIAETEEAYYSL